MAITLGEIAVKLTANTVDFISGFSSAGVATKRFRADLSDHVGAVGDVLERALSQFGEFGATVGGTLERATAAAGQAIVSFGKLGGSMGTVVGVGAGVAAGLAVAEAGIIGFAIHSAEGAAKLGEMSQKAGISAQSLAGLSLAGKGVGVEAESIVKSFGFLSSNLLKSASAADFSHTALGRLGFTLKDVTDSTGKVRDLGELFPAIATKIAALPTSEQGAFVKAIFGRGGLEILPLILEGADKITAKMQLAAKLGLGDAETIATAQQFKETTSEIGAEFEAIGLRLAKDLLPTLNNIVTKIDEWGQSGKLKGFIDDLAYIVRLTLAAGVAIVDYVKEIGNITFGTGKSLIDAGKSVVHGDVSGAAAGLKDHFRTLGAGFPDAIKDFHDVMSDTLAVPPKPTPIPHGADLSQGKTDTTLDRIKERFEALRQEAIDWGNTAKAATEAETLIAKAVEKGNQAFRKETEFAARDKTGNAEKFVAQHEAQIKAAAASVFYDQTLVKTNEELDKQSDTLTQTDKATIDLGNAYKQGGAAVAAAALDQKFAKEAAAIAELAGVRDVAALKGKLERNEALARKVASDELVVSLARESSEFAALAPSVDALNAAYLRGEDAVRAARIELQLQQFAQEELRKGVVLDQQAIEAKRKILVDADRQAYQGQLAQEAAQFNLNAQYDNTVVKLQRVREVMQEQGVSTLGVDAQIFDEQNRLIHQWDEWALKVGTFQQKFQAVMGELVIQGRNAGAAIGNAFISAIDSVETGLAKLLTGQKADFKAIFQNLAESVTKAEIQKGVGSLAERFGFKIPGLTGKADGSESNPFYVVLKGATATGTSAGSLNPFGGFGLGANAPAAGSSSGVGGFLSTIGSLFSGFHATGGSVPSGHWGIAGERGPEIITGPANVVPAGPTYNITHNHNYPTAESRDLFGRTQKQNQARQTRNMRMAYGF